MLNFASSFKPEKQAFEEAFKMILEDDDAVIYIAMDHNKLVGYCLAFSHHTFYANGRVCWVEEIMVDEGMRGQDIGSQLMQSFERWAEAREAKLVALATRRAAPFYLAVGYEESATYFRKLLK